MQRIRLAGCWFVVFAAALLGCPMGTTALDPLPQSPSDTSTPGPTGGALPTGGSTVVSSGGGTSDTTVSDALSRQYPECTFPRQAADWRDSVLQLVNRERGLRGLSRLTRSATLEAQAETYACEMVHYDFFDHVNPSTGSTLRDRAGQFGYDYQVIGENLAAGQPTPEQAFADWMDSPGHRQNILDDRFTEIGIGVRTGGQYGTYWVQEFGRPR